MVWDKGKILFSSSFVSVIPQIVTAFHSTEQLEATVVRGQCIISLRSPFLACSSSWSPLPPPPPPGDIPLNILLLKIQIDTFPHILHQNLGNYLNVPCPERQRNKVKGKPMNLISILLCSWALPRPSWHWLWRESWGVLTAEQMPRLFAHIIMCKIIVNVWNCA